MKKLLILAIVAGAFSMTSCKKEYTCDCTVTVSATGVPTTSTTGSTKIKDTKKKAKEACDKLDKSPVTTSGITYETACSIK